MDLRKPVRVSHRIDKAMHIAYGRDIKRITPNEIGGTCATMLNRSARLFILGCGLLLSLGDAALATAPVVSLSPTTLNFGPMYVNKTTPAQKVTLSNTGNSTLGITSIAASGDFAQTNTCGSSVAAGGNCTISVTFKPTTTGTRTGAITITDNASDSPQSVALTGNGIVAIANLTPTTWTF